MRNAICRSQLWSWYRAVVCSGGGGLNGMFCRVFGKKFYGDGLWSSCRAHSRGEEGNWLEEVRGMALVGLVVR